MAEVVLRYFPIVGRAQPLRHALLDAGVEFEDLRTPLHQWPDRRGDPSFGGAYGSLPTLTWDGRTISETLAIAFFLARTLGHVEGLDDFAVGRIEGLVSCCYLEVGQRVGELIWADMLWPGADLAVGFSRFVDRMEDKLQHIEGVLPESGWFSGTAPTIADFFAAEAQECVGALLGPDATARFPKLRRISEDVRNRPALAGAFRSRPDNFTAHPDEPTVIERLRSLRKT